MQPWSTAKYDACGVCGGRNQTCSSGCDFKPYSNKTHHAKIHVDFQFYVDHLTDSDMTFVGCVQATTPHALVAMELLPNSQRDMTCAMCVEATTRCAYQVATGNLTLSRSMMLVACVAAMEGMQHLICYTISIIFRD